MQYEESDSEREGCFQPMLYYLRGNRRATVIFLLFVAGAMVIIVLLRNFVTGQHYTTPTMLVGVLLPGVISLLVFIFIVINYFQERSSTKLSPRIHYLPDENESSDYEDVIQSSERNSEAQINLQMNYQPEIGEQSEDDSLRIRTRSTKQRRVNKVADNPSNYSGTRMHGKHSRSFSNSDIDLYYDNSNKNEAWNPKIRFVSTRHQRIGKALSDIPSNSGIKIHGKHSRSFINSDIAVSYHKKSKIEASNPRIRPKTAERQILSEELGNPSSSGIRMSGRHPRSFSNSDTEVYYQKNGRNEILNPGIRPKTADHERISKALDIPSSSGIKMRGRHPRSFSNSDTEVYYQENSKTLQKPIETDGWDHRGRNRYEYTNYNSYQDILRSARLRRNISDMGIHKHWNKKSRDNTLSTNSLGGLGNSRERQYYTTKGKELSEWEQRNRIIEEPLKRTAHSMQYCSRGNDRNSKDSSLRESKQSDNSLGRNSRASGNFQNDEERPDYVSPQKEIEMADQVKRKTIYFSSRTLLDSIHQLPLGVSEDRQHLTRNNRMVQRSLSSTDEENVDYSINDQQAMKRSPIHNIQSQQMGCFTEDTRNNSQEMSYGTREYPMRWKNLAERQQSSHF